MDTSRYNLKRKFSVTNFNRKFIKWGDNRRKQKKYVYFKNKGKNNATLSSLPLPDIHETEGLITFDTHLMRYLEKIEMPKLVMDRKIKNVICHLQTQLKEADIPYRRIEPFGSSVTGLSLKDSDIDIFIECQNPRLEVMKKIKKCLIRNPFFRDILLIGFARVPIIKGYYVPDNIEFDLSIFSHLGCENTALTKEFFRFDECLRPLIMLLKHCLKIFDLHGVGKINTYALTWLVIFYLQTKKTDDHVGVNNRNNRLPSVRQLQALTNGRLVSVKSWNCSFTFEGLDKPSSASVYDLVRDFFIFHLKFDYQNYVMSPFTGTAIPLADFKNADKLPSCFSLYKNLVNGRQAKPFGSDHYIFLQDPFEHNLNIIKQASVSVIKQFRQLCAIGAKIFQENGAGSFSAVCKLLTYRDNVGTRITAPVPPPPASSPTPPTITTIDVAKDNVIKLKYKHFPGLLVQKDGLQKLFEALRYVLQRVLLFQVVPFNQYTTIKKTPVADTVGDEMMISVIAPGATAVNGITAAVTANAGNGAIGLDYNSKIVLNCSTFYDTITKRVKKMKRRKRFKFEYEIDLEEKRSAQSVILVNDEINVRLEFVPYRFRQMIHLNLNGPPFFTNFLKQNCILYMRQALCKIYQWNPNAPKSRLQTPQIQLAVVHVVSDDDDDDDNDNNNDDVVVVVNDDSDSSDSDDEL